MDMTVRSLRHLLVLSVPLVLLLLLPQRAECAPAQTRSDVTTMKPCSGNYSDCIVHVFRVQLTDRLSGVTKEEDVLPLKPKKRYGQNVFAPVRNNDSHVLTERIVAKMPPDIDDSIKRRVMNEDFLISPVDENEEEEPVEQVDPEQVFQERQTRQREAGSTPTKKVLPDEHFPLFLTLLLVAIGVVVGILCTCLGLFLLDYKRKPKFDRSTAISYKRPSQSIREKIIYDPQRKIVERSTEMHRMYPTSSRTPSVRPPPRMDRLLREHEMLRAASRESDRRLRQERKISF